MTKQPKDPLVAVSHRIRPAVRTWLAVEASQKHDRSANWLVNKILDAAYNKAQQEKAQQTEGAQA